MSDFPKQLKFSEHGRRRVLTIAKQLAKASLGREDRYKAYLSSLAGVHRHTIANALDKGKACTFDTIDGICTALNLSWEEVCTVDSGENGGDRLQSQPVRRDRFSVQSAIPDRSSTQGSRNNQSPVHEVRGNHFQMQQERINGLVKDIRQQVASRIERECGTVRMSRSQSIDNLVEPSLYTISYLPSEQFKASSLLTGEIDEANFDRMGIVPQYDVQVKGKTLIEERRRLLVYASPGCGKTSYLKWLAIQCNRGDFLPHCVPVFISMRAFAPQALHKNLYSFIEDYLVGCGVRDVDSISYALFQESRIFLLLDGLDEVPGAMRETVDRHVEEVLNRSFNGYYAFSCRLALRLGFADGFQKTVIAPFNAKQRALYVKRWFQASTADARMERKFSDRLRRHINFGELTRTPLLLDLLCRVFQDHDTFPSTRAGVYDWGLESLLKEESRKHRTNSTLSQLSIERTRDLLQAIAADFFLRPHPQTLFDRKEVERKIQDFFQSQMSLSRTSSNGSFPPQSLPPSSFSQPSLSPPNNVSPPWPLPNGPAASPGIGGAAPPARKLIEDIEVTYGLMIQQASNYCSFSHLTFQEYFTAEYLVKTNQHALVHQRITDSQWRFVIELVAELLSASQTNAFFLGYQHALCQLVASNGKIQAFLNWVDSMAIAIRSEVNSRRSYSQTLLRAWYFVSTLDNPMTTQNIGAVSSKFEFPDFDYATSVIRSKSLDLHRLFYQAYHATLAEPMQEPEPSNDSFDDLAEGLTMMPMASSRNYRVQETSGRYGADGFIRLVESIYKSIQHDPALENHIAGWLEMIHRQLANHSIPQDWWHHRRQFWHGKVARFMKSRYDLRCQWEFTESDKSLLRAYYDAAKLLSICMNRTQNLAPNEYQTLAENLLLRSPLSSLGVEEYDGLTDEPTETLP
ncbi:MAG: NACHT domain-containing protein [Cyanobacteria bacterium P01_F01_bin.150]